MLVNSSVVCQNGGWTSFPICNSSPEIECTSNLQCPVTGTECRDSVCKCKSAHSFVYSLEECSTAPCLKFADTFQSERGYKIPYHDTKWISGTTMEHCLQQCISDTTFACASFEYNSMGDCHLQSETASQVSLYASDSWTYYQRDCIEIGSSNVQP